MLRHRFLVSACALFCGLCSFARGPEALAAPAQFRVGYVDLQRALGESRAGKAAQKDYEGEVAKEQGSIDKKKQEFEILRSNFSKQKESLNDGAKQDKEEKLLTMERDLKRAYQDSQEKLRRKNVTIVGDLIKQLREVVQDFGRSEGYTMILEKNGNSVLFADSSIDITSPIVSRFDGATNKKQ